MTQLLDEKEPTNKITIERPENKVLLWQDLNITTPNGEKCILNSITGEVRSGESLAIMGSSGAGKTTLLNYLSKKSGASTVGLKKTNGEVKFIIDGVDQTYSFKQLSSYVTQDDFLIEIMTPRELFTFAAEMRLFNKTKEEKSKIVEKLIVKLGLEKCAETRVGDVLIKGLSGGEKKRTSIGYELITDPKVLFLDEPTTGLDAVSALKIVKLITEEAKINNRIVIFTIHQPNSEIFNLFESLLLLAQGKTMYKGNAKNGITYFSQLGYECPLNYNPAEFFIKILSKESKMVDTLNIKKNKLLIKNDIDEDDDDLSSSFINFSPPDEEQFKKEIKLYEDQIERFNQKFKEINKVTDTQSYPVNMNSIDIPRNGFCQEFSLLWERNSKILLRNKSAFILRIIITVIKSILTILVFNSLGKGNNAVLDRNGCLYFIINSVVQTNLQKNIMTFGLEYPKFYKEQESSMYGVLPYYFSKTLPEIPIQIFLSLIVFLSTYFFAGFSTDSVGNFFYFYLTILLAGYAGSTFAVFLSSIFQDRNIILAVFPLLLYTQIIAAGFLANVKNFPFIFYPFKYISVFRYGYQALCWNEYRNYTPESLECLEPTKCKFPTEDFPEDLTWSLLALVTLCFANNVLSYAAIKIQVYLKNK